MSWLVVAFIPGLLMLATFGLQRLEASLETDTLSEPAEFLDDAQPNGVRDEADYLPSSAEWATDQFRAGALIPAVHQPAAARHPHDHSRSNRQFAPRQHANRV